MHDARQRGDYERLSIEHEFDLQFENTAVGFNQGLRKKTLACRELEAGPTYESGFTLTGRRIGAMLRL